MTKKLTQLILAFLLLTGFTSNGQLLELQGNFHGRASANFVGRTNVLSVLPKGTLGKVLQTKNLPSGNYGIQIEVLNGSEKNQKLWIYYKVSEPTIALYRDREHLRVNAALSQGEIASQIEKATSTKVLRATAAQTTPPTGNSQHPTPESLLTQGTQKLQSSNRIPEVCTENCLVTTNRPRISSQLLRPSGSRRMAPACSNIISNEGLFGSTGSSLYEIMSKEEYKNTFIKDNALGQLCPKFSHLSETEKLYAWTWFWTALATEESSCREDIHHPTTYRDRRTGEIKVLNPYAGHGLWALEKDRNIRAWRGSACSNIGTAHGQALCSVDIMAKQLDSKGTADIRSGSYWGPLHRASSQLIPHMRRLSLCF